MEDFGRSIQRKQLINEFVGDEDAISFMDVVNLNDIIMTLLIQLERVANALKQSAGGRCIS